MLFAMLACKGTLGAVIRLVSLEIATRERLEANSALHLRKLAALEQGRVLVEVPVKLSQFALPLTPQPATAAAHYERTKRAFQADIGIGDDFFAASGTRVLGVAHALDTTAAKAVAAARDLVWFAQHEQADGAVGLH